VSPVGGEGSRREIEISYQLQSWSRANQGVAFSSSVHFSLPNWSKRGPYARQAYIYRWNREMEFVDSPVSLSGENVLPEFLLDLTMIWVT
jgi:Uma2 family endonuclease